VRLCGGKDRSVDMAKKKTGVGNADPGRNPVLAEQLAKAIRETPEVVVVPAPRVTDVTPPPENLPALVSLKGLKAGDLIVVEYAMLPGRVPGVYGAEVVTVSKDGNDVSIKFLYPSKPPRAGALKTVVRKGNEKEIVDAGDQRVVVVKRPNRKQLDSINEIRRSVDLRSPGKPPLKLGEVAAFVYPKVPAWGGWAAGVSIGIVTKAQKREYEVTFYLPEFLEEYPQSALEAIEMELGEDGEYTDKKYGCKLAMVRNPTPAEIEKFQEDRKTVLALKAIPNAPKPR
jgi:hypothetical protein